MILFFFLIISDNGYCGFFLGDEELEKGEEVILCEKHDKSWWSVFHLKKRKQILVRSSVLVKPLPTIKEI